MADRLSSLSLTPDSDDQMTKGFDFPPPPRLHCSGISDTSDSSDSEKVYGIRGSASSRKSSHLRSSKVKKLPDPVPIGFFWDIENCQVPKGCSALDIVASMRHKFLYGRREADFVVVCDARKETPTLLQELDDAQVSVIHVSGTQKNAADEKLRQYMRRFADQYLPPAVLLLVSGDVNFVADLSDFRHRRRLKVILVHGPKASNVLIATATQHYQFSELTKDLPRIARRHCERSVIGKKCHVMIGGLADKSEKMRTARRLKQLADNCGGKVLNVMPPNAVLRFPTEDMAVRAVKRMDGEDVFGSKISATMMGDTSSDEGYGTPAAKTHTKLSCNTDVVLLQPTILRNDRTQIKPLQPPITFDTTRSVALTNPDVLPPHPNNLQMMSQKATSHLSFSNAQTLNSTTPHVSYSTTQSSCHPSSSVTPLLSNAQTSSYSMNSAPPHLSYSNTQTLSHAINATVPYLSYSNTQTSTKSMNSIHPFLPYSKPQPGSLSIKSANPRLSHSNFQISCQSMSSAPSHSSHSNPQSTYSCPDYVSKVSNSVASTQSSMSYVGNPKAFPPSMELHAGSSIPKGWTSQFVAQHRLYRAPSRVNTLRSLSANCFPLQSNGLSSANLRPVSVHPSPLSSVSSVPPSPSPAQLPQPSNNLMDIKRDRMPRKITRRHSLPNGNVQSSEESGSDRSGASYGDSGVDLTVHNLPPLGADLLRKSLEILFSEYVKVLRLVVGGVGASGDGLTARVTVRDEATARVAISRLHRRHWCGRRLLLSPTRPAPPTDRAVVRARLRHLLESAPDRSLPLLRLRELYTERFGHPLPASELGKAHDIVRMCDSPRGRRVVLLAPASNPDSGLDPRDAGLVPRRCELHDQNSVSEANGDSALLVVRLSENELSRSLNVLLTSHEGVVPLASLHACYGAQFRPLQTDLEGGVLLELLVRTIPTFCILEQPVRHITWMREETAPSPNNNKVFGFMMDLVSRELTDLLIIQPRCIILFTKLVPAYHNHFGHQLRVADFGFTRLSDLLDSLSETVVVLGSGHGRIVTLSPGAQARRFATDACRVLQKVGKALEFQELESTWSDVHGTHLKISDYGACFIDELVLRAVQTQRSPIALPSPGSVALSSPIRVNRSRAPQTNRVEPVENFANEAVLLLGQMPKMSVELSRFVPAYHAHFGRQCHVGRYGCLKLIELLEKCPQAVTVDDSDQGERQVRLSPHPMKDTLRRRIAALTPIPLSHVSSAYLTGYAASLPIDGDIADAIYSLGFEIRGGLVLSKPAANEYIAQKALLVAICLPSDRCVGGGSDKLQMFERTYAGLTGASAPLEDLRSAGVLAPNLEGDRVALSRYWRTVSQMASLLAGHEELLPRELASRCPHAEFPAEAILRAEPGVFEELPSGRFRLHPGLALVAQMIAPPPVPLSPDFGLDTPPGQQGSRVFESPAPSALPVPSMLLQNDHSRRRNLAPVFGASTQSY